MDMWSLFILISLSFSSQSQILDHRFFLTQLIDKYGYNGTITYEGFERLYKNLGLGDDISNQVSTATTLTSVVGNGLPPPHQSSATNTSVSPGDGLPLSRPSRDISSSNKECKSIEELARLVVQHNEIVAEILPQPTQQCLAPREVLAVYGVKGPKADINAASFLHLCPAIVYQLDQRTCVWSHTPSRAGHGHALDTTHANWFFASLSILVISVSGLLCVAIVPLLHRTFVSQLISFLVALAVGTLLGDAFLHLIPHALETNETSQDVKHTNSIMKTALIFLTVVFFFTFESILNVFRAKKEKQKVQDNVQYTSVRVNQNETEMMEIGEKKLEIGHNHSHSAQNNIALMVIMGDGLHNLTDGLAIGAAFAGGVAPGFATAVAVFTHELPHELGDFAVLLQSGMTVRKALLYNLLSSVLSAIGTVLGLTVGEFGDATSWIYAITAGSFIYIALANLVPEINKEESSARLIVLRVLGVMSGGTLMACIALFEHDIHNLFL